MMTPVAYVFARGIGPRGWRFWAKRHFSLGVGAGGVCAAVNLARAAGLTRGDDPELVAFELRRWRRRERFQSSGA